MHFNKHCERNFSIPVCLSNADTSPKNFWEKALVIWQKSFRYITREVNTYGFTPGGSRNISIFMSARLSWIFHCLINLEKLGKLSMRLCIYKSVNMGAVALLELLGVLTFGIWHGQWLTKSSVHVISSKLGCLCIWIQWTYYATLNLLSILENQFSLEITLRIHTT